MPEETPKISGEVQISEKITAELEDVTNVANYRARIENYLKENVSGLVEVILAGAIHLRASDLHFEPTQENAKLRIRIDGILQDVLFFDLSIYQTLLSRIKLLSKVKLNISDRPQDGRFSIEMGYIRKRISGPIEIRTSSLPAEYGESIVMRILDPKNLIQLEALGIRKDILRIVKSEIKRPNGMIVVTGPTGSGKTTTLYAFLRQIKTPEIKIITIEDPIEYHLEGISQTQVAAPKGYNFASGLKSVMRQDPDVILVGEMRDPETVETALQAALTGHLVLTTLHTNDAAGVLARLTSLGARLANIGPALNMVIAQRLVRKVCPECRKTRVVLKSELQEIKKEFGSVKTKIKIPQISSSLRLPRAQGCKKCNSTGYQGRTGIFEVFLIDDQMEKFILKEPSIVGLKEMAIKRGMITMKQDGLIKVLEGITTLEEVKRITG